VHEKDIFENFTNDVRGDKLKVNAIIDTEENNLLLGTDKGLYIFDKSQKTFEIFPSVNPQQMEVLSLVSTGNNIIVGTDRGLYNYNCRNKTFLHLNDTLKDHRIQVILRESDDKIWVGTEGIGLFLLNPETGDILKNYLNNPYKEESICSNYIRTLLIDNENRLWIGTFHGLSVLNNNDERFHNYYSDPFDASTISQNSIRSIIQDSQRGIWLGTYYGGVNYYHPLKNQFFHIKQNSHSNSLNDRIISGIVEDKSSGKIWIGTNDNGINVYEPQTGRFTHISKENNNILLSNNIKSFLLSRDNRHIYIGSHGGGLIKMDKNSYKPVGIQLSGKDVYSLAYDSNNDIWAGTLSGLFKFDEKKESIEEFDIGKLTSSQIFYVATDSKNRLWIGGDKSLACLAIDSRDLVEFNDTFQNVRINCIIEDSKQNIWIGTNRGIYKYTEDKKFIRYTEKDGLSNNMVCGIIEDSLGFLWISTYYGICRFDPEQTVFRTYLMTDGLQFQQFNNYSFCKTESGRLYFGGIGGIISFIPEQLKNNPLSFQPIITELNVQNKIIEPSEHGILEKNIINANKIVLRADQATFSLRFAVPNYLSGKHNTFKYKLEGYDKDWIITSENHFAFYSNLPHGKYTFQLLSANNEGYWNDTMTELSVIVKPLWFQTVWFGLLVIGVILFIIYTTSQFFNQKQKIKKQLIKERFDKEKNEEINQAKMSFFVNISHEFRTPLTLIISPLQEIIEKVSDSWEKEQLTVIKNNADKLLRLTNQLIDYRRAELGVFELNLKRTDPKTTIVKTMALFNKLAKRINIEYGFEDYTNDDAYFIDENYLDMILSNLLSNSFKFTPPNGRITVTLIEDFEYLILEVEDTGCGIPKHKQSLIFNRFYKENNKKDDIGMGIGLSITQRLVELHHGKIEVKSKTDEGTTFSIYIPQNENFYTKKELDNISLLPVEDPSEEQETVYNVALQNDEQARIMIVEDDEDLLNYLSNSISSSYNIITATNGKEALELLSQNKVDIVLTDIMMNVMDGIELCRTLKGDIKTCHIPIIILSAKSTVEDQLLGFGVGADDYVTKPFTASILKAKINNMLASKERILNYYSDSTEIDPEKITTNQIDNELLTKAKEIVLRNLDNTSFTTEMLCLEMGMSRTNLHLKLKALTGKSAIDFIRKVRFSEATKLLSNGKYNVSEVGYMVGFNSSSYFSTSFKKYFGYLPSDHIKK
jgi:signal transduction histidine kinase/ligand-binding sensor domain-containing protein/DNA-binding response OmpR family regulator